MDETNLAVQQEGSLLYILSSWGGALHFFDTPGMQHQRSALCCLMREYGFTWKDAKSTVVGINSATWLRDLNDTTLNVYFASKEHFILLARYSYLLVSKSQVVTADEVKASLPNIQTTIERLVATNCCAPHTVFPFFINACE
jgi:hypothetical protein